MLAKKLNKDIKQYNLLLATAFAESISGGLKRERTFAVSISVSSFSPKV